MSGPDQLFIVDKDIAMVAGGVDSSKDGRCLRGCGAAIVAGLAAAISSNSSVITHDFFATFSRLFLDPKTISSSLSRSLLPIRVIFARNGRGWVWCRGWSWRWRLVGNARSSTETGAVTCIITRIDSLSTIIPSLTTSLSRSIFYPPAISFSPLYRNGPA